MAIEGNERSKRSCELILSHFEQDLPYHDSLALYFENANLWWTMLLRTHAYDRAKSHGLDFVEDNVTRDMLYDLFEQKTTFTKILIWLRMTLNLMEALEQRLLTELERK